MKNLWLIIAILSGVIIWLLFFKAEPKPSQVNVSLIEQSHKVKMDSIVAHDKVIKESLTLEVEKHKASSEVFRIENKRLKKLIVNKKEIVREVIKNDPQLIDLVNLFDSSSNVLEAKVFEDSIHIEALTVKYNELLSSGEAKVTLSEQTRLAESAQNQAEIKKVKRRIIRVIVVSALVNVAKDVLIISIIL